MKKTLSFILFFSFVSLTPAHAEPDWRQSMLFFCGIATCQFIAGLAMSAAPSPYWQCNRPEEPIECCNLNAANCSSADKYEKFPCTPNQVVMCGGGSYVAVREPERYKITGIVSSAVLAGASMVGVGLLIKSLRMSAVSAQIPFGAASKDVVVQIEEAKQI